MSEPATARRRGAQTARQIGGYECRSTDIHARRAGTPLTSTERHTFVTPRRSDNRIFADVVAAHDGAFERRSSAATRVEEGFRGVSTR